MMTIKNPVRLACIIVGTAAFLCFGDGPLGVAFLLGSFVGSFNVR